MVGIYFTVSLVYQSQQKLSIMTTTITKKQVSFLIESTVILCNCSKELAAKKVAEHIAAKNYVII